MDKTEEKRSKHMDMLHGPMAKKILLFTLPIAASSILQQLFNSADVAVVGRFAEQGALAAVGSNAVLVGLFVSVFTGLSVGVNVLISNYIGQQRNDKVSAVVHTGLLFSFICGIAIMAVGIAFARPLLMMMDSPADVLDRAVLYLRIYCTGMPFIIPYNFGAAILRSVGDTKRPLYCLVASGLLNVCLNLLFVIVFHMGVAGVAAATVISNIFSTAAIVIILCRENDTIRLRFSKLKIEGASLKRIMRIGAPAALQCAVFSISNICLQTAVNSFGSDAVGGMTAGINFEYFCCYIINAFAAACITFVGHNYGAGDFGRCKRAIVLCVIEAAIGSVALSAAFVLGRDLLVRIYTVEPAEIEYAIMRLMCVTPFTCLTISFDVMGSALRGMGRSVVPALLTVVGSVIFRVIWVYTVFEKWNSFASIVIVYPVSWTLTGIMVVGYYFIMRRRMYSAHTRDNNLPPCEAEM